ncbi:Thioesterase superfamily [Desulfobotulus alkaliphilus]|uniref:Thioesterase superfamily n=1 Tax=Desulfobotulus alkaliphilus TaxID=622671 RepID=A0A562R6X2_9BACT|nr:hotdog domain-containing protein [Desulfobotulus alkaliphilus]TWI64829.1 Thioesterase superfamily [Desulfobotulus alkaliphilus]
MNIQTHQNMDTRLCGLPERVENGTALLSMQTLDCMVADASGLIHGGFLFGLADHAAMLAVNHPNVVLGESTCRFLKPVVLGDLLIAEAKIIHSKGKKYEVTVSLRVSSKIVFSGNFICFTPEKHVLAGNGSSQ